MNYRQSIHLNSIKNSRELGGYATADGRKIKSGVLLRTGRLNEISEKDIRKLKDTYRLGHIIDFRMSMELPDSPDPAIDGAEYHHLDVIDISSFFSDVDIPDFDITKLDPFEVAELTIKSGIQNDRMYIGFLSCDTGKKAFGDFFRILLSADRETAVLWHCTSGKDRTGLAAMLLLSAFGVDEEVIVDDYLLTNEYNAQRIEGARQLMIKKGYDEDFITQAVIVFDAVDESYMRNALSYLKKEYGSVLGYIKDGLKISQKEIDSLKEKYLV